LDWWPIGTLCRVPGWVTADEAYGQTPTFRGWQAAHQVRYVLATRNDDVLSSPDGHRRQGKVLATLAEHGDGGGWERRSIGGLHPACGRPACMIDGGSPERCGTEGQRP
jgi:hypothetical protein